MLLLLHYYSYYYYYALVRLLLLLLPLLLLLLLRTPTSPPPTPLPPPHYLLPPSTYLRYPPMPCPYGCGWESTTIQKGGWRSGRRISGIRRDMWLLGPSMRCKNCYEAREALKEAGDDLYKQKHYKFQCWNEESLRL